MDKIKVLIADDNSFIREGLKIILSSYEDFEVVVTVENGREAISYCKNHAVDIALLDVRMPDMNGVEATKAISEQTSAKPVILTTFDDDEYIVDALKYGAKGYLLKNNDPEKIRDAIKSVYAGNSIFQDVILDKIKTNLGDREPEPKIDPKLFTKREREIMSLIAKGLSNKEIAKTLFISEGTVANYITSIFGKTGLEHRTQIAVYYLTGKVK
ncbi:DNA-binding response regulator [Weizmannia acidilactici]|uniref:DNA-binding response regulator n=1 Tax=Weizmannia acidilactici TaxID=2607726 RepID=A0A5J4JMA8_9BACI|nr:response regulator transcription factor [Weizmannia acidilactici]GER67810.1 DNA-binding response regulator [Weizmannia acidilactici]GER71790.1 DNA-binding response regulator [Weizmannia acidilactici]GER74065.1 DNA-binding response regulator [Weizmannia acidilactici]